MGLLNFISLRWLFRDQASAQQGAVPNKRVVYDRLPIPAFESLGSELLDYGLRFWFDNREGTAPPDWSCFRPEQHPNLLANILLYERVDGRYMTLIVGDVIAHHIGPNAQGKFLDEVAPADTQPDTTMRLNRALSDGLPNYVQMVRLWEERTRSFGLHALRMPFQSRRDNRERVLCIMEAHEDKTPTS